MSKGALKKYRQKNTHPLKHFDKLNVTRMGYFYSSSTATIPPAHTYPLLPGGEKPAYPAH